MGGKLRGEIMAKSKTIFVCQNCGVESAKWIGRCPSCKEWNTYHEEIVAPASSHEKAFVLNQEKRKPELLDSIEADEHGRQKTGISELDRILGGGIVRGITDPSGWRTWCRKINTGPSACPCP